jgi:hypothetical protein
VTTDCPHFRNLRRCWSRLDSDGSGERIATTCFCCAPSGQAERQSPDGRCLLLHPGEQHRSPPGFIPWSPLLCQARTDPYCGPCSTRWQRNGSGGRHTCGCLCGCQLQDSPDHPDIVWLVEPMSPRVSRIDQVGASRQISDMSTLAEIETAAGALRAGDRQELVLFLAARLRTEGCPYVGAPSLQLPGNRVVRGASRSRP